MVITNCNDYREKVIKRTIFVFKHLATDGIVECEIDTGSLMPQVFFFIAQLVSGIGQTLCSTLGISYMDDNSKQHLVLFMWLYFLSFLFISQSKSLKLPL